MNSIIIDQMFSEVETAVDGYDVTTEPLGVVFYIVGDKFSEFSDNNIILTYSATLEHLRLIVQIARCIVIGQGVSKSEVCQLQDLIQRSCSLRYIKILHKTDLIISKELVDKQTEKNVLITLPDRASANRFQCNLVIDDDCAEMVDCHTSEHIQGILLVEAAKQMFMACVRTYDIAPEFPSAIDQTRFTLSGLNVRFDHFVFPLAVKLELILKDIAINGSSASGSAMVKVCQFDRVCCEITLCANAYSQRFFSSLEKRCAIKAKKRLQNNLLAFI